MVIYEGIKCNSRKIEQYLKDWNVNISNINIYVNDGKWTFKTLGEIKDRNIYVYLPKWVFMSRDKAIAKIILHEYLHIKGIDKCLSNSKSCIMYEGSWYREILVMSLQWINNWSLCDKCKKFLMEQK